MITHWYVSSTPSGFDVMRWSPSGFEVHTTITVGERDNPSLRWALAQQRAASLNEDVEIPDV